MLSLGKILLLIGVAFAAWYGYRLWQRLNAPERADRVARGGARREEGARKSDSVQDMRACPVCGIYMSASAGPCERSDCPRR